MTRLPRTCLLGAGSSGIPVIKALRDRGIPFDCYEKGDRVGGNWVFRNANGMSSAYRSLHINTSRDRMQYAEFPMPRDYPDFAHHTLLAKYFDDYVEHFQLRQHIHFGCGVARAAHREGGGWLVSLEDGRTEAYDHLVVANGHHWDPQWPDPPFPGSFDGVQMHSHHYVDPDEPHPLRGKRVVVLGMGNSAMDIACELSTRGVAERVFLSARRGAYVVPHYILGKPLDQSMQLPTWLPIRTRIRIGTLMHRTLFGRMSDYGLPEPDHEVGEAHPTISSELLPKLGRGDITVKPNIERLEGREVRFTDGSVEDVDVIIYCTGYKVSFPFFEPSFLEAKDNELPLFKRTFAPRVPDVSFVGLMQPLGAIMPIAERQAKLIADYVAGDYVPPDPAAMEADIVRDRAAMRARYVASKRHTMQVDFDDFMQELAHEHAAGKRRAGRS